MFLMMRLGYKGMKKAHKSYKKHQAEKSARAELPEIEDPSKELDMTCEATHRSSISSSDSGSSTEAKRALEEDPEFKEFMDRQKSIYLSQHRASPPTYLSVLRERSADASNLANSETPTSFQSVTETHCSCHTCQAVLSPSTPKSSEPHTVTHQRPASHGQENAIYELMDSAKIELPSQTAESESASQTAKSTNDSQAYELPAELPASYPSVHSTTAVELPAETS